MQEIIEEQELATDDERKGLSKLCIWEGTTEMSTFFCYIQSLYHTCGRTCEAAAMLKQNLSVFL